MSAGVPPGDRRALADGAPGGTLALATWGQRTLEPAQTLLLDAVAAERPDLDLRGATLPWARINSPEALTEVMVGGGAGTPQITTETMVRPTTADDVWRILLGTGYRLLLDHMSPDGVLRVRTTLRDRVRRERIGEITADVLYAVAHKGAGSDPPSSSTTPIRS